MGMKVGDVICQSHPESVSLNSASAPRSVGAYPTSPPAVFYAAAATFSPDDTSLEAS